MKCIVCNGELEQENQTNICMNCDSIIANIEEKIDSF